MSAIRNSVNRTEARRKRALPYARSTGITGFFRRIFGLDGGEEHESDLPELPTTMPTGHAVTDEPAINFSRNQSNSYRFGPPPTSSHNRQPLSQTDFINYAPLGARDPPLPSFSNADVNGASNNGNGKASISGSTHSADSSVSQRQTTPEKSEVFRFTYTTRLESLSAANVTHAPASTTSSTKKLKRNPNGDYRWDGPGSAKRSRQRNRFASPAFGATPTKGDRAQNFNMTTEMDQKRRKTGESTASTSESPTSSLPFPITGSPSASKGNGSGSRTPPIVTNTSRLRTPAKPTAPVVPSPLRNAWSDSSPNSREEPGKITISPAKPTQTATLMADLIKETIPPKKPDLSNPYQTASPVAKVGPPRRGARRPRPAPRPEVPAKEDEHSEERKLKDKFENISPQAIIEATLPKGSKRSRPPANFERSKSPDFEQAETHYQVEEPEEESGRASKKPKPSLNGNGRPSSLSTVPPMTGNSDVTAEEISDTPLPENFKDENKAKAKDGSKLMNGNASTSAAASATPSTSRASFSALRAIPKEPSKLRFSFQADGTVGPALTPPPITTLSPAPEPQALPITKSDNQGSAVPSTGFDFSFNPGGDVHKAEVITVATESRPPTVEEVKSDVAAMDVDVLPMYTFFITAVSMTLSSADEARAREDVKVLPPASLPAFSFTGFQPTDGFKFGTAPVISTPAVTSIYKESRVDAPPVKAFDFAAAGMKRVEEKDVWTCFCGVKNANSADKCIACESPSPSTNTNKPVETPKSVVPSAPEVKGFDFAAAGFKMPTVNKDTWTCSECTLSNPNSASTCGPCGADRK